MLGTMHVNETFKGPSLYDVMQFWTTLHLTPYSRSIIVVTKSLTSLDPDVIYGRPLISN